MRGPESGTPTPEAMWGKEAKEKKARQIVETQKIKNAGGEIVLYPSAMSIPVMSVVGATTSREKLLG